MRHPTSARSASSMRQPSSESADALMQRVAHADMAAFETLYRAYAHRVRGFLERNMPRSTLIEEVLNDTMLVVWHKAHSYNATSKVSTWIFAIAYRKARKALRRADNIRALGDPSGATVFASGPDRELQRSELREHLSDALNALSAEHRAVIQLTYYQGYGCREIADLVGCPIDTVKTRMFYARRRLKAMLAVRGEEAL
jgi:RNA polymerase sigma factor (sigma-70 family)